MHCFTLRSVQQEKSQTIVLWDTIQEINNVRDNYILPWNVEVHFFHSLRADNRKCLYLIYNESHHTINLNAINPIERAVCNPGITMASGASSLC